MIGPATGAPDGVCRLSTFGCQVVFGHVHSSPSVPSVVLPPLVLGRHTLTSCA